MSDAEDTFISHLIEMRDRLLRAILAVVIIFICLFPWRRICMRCWPNAAGSAAQGRADDCH